MQKNDVRNDVRVAVYLDREAARRLEEIAAHNDRSVSWIVRWIVLDHLSRNPPPGDAE